jgi:hypothetical protein
MTRYSGLWHDQVRRYPTEWLAFGPECLLLVRSG